MSNATSTDIPETALFIFITRTDRRNDGSVVFRARALVMSKNNGIMASEKVDPGQFGAIRRGGPPYFHLYTYKFLQYFAHCVREIN